MKIKDTIINPYYSYTFNNIENKIVYYYLNDNINISLSYLFENTYNLLKISFNDQILDNYNITDMKGIFSDCQYLKNINFNVF